MGVPAQYKAKPFPGTAGYQRQAAEALPRLVRQAFTQEPVTYGDLAAEMGIPFPLNLNYVLGSIGNALIELGKKWGETIPPIQALVVNQKTKIPGSGGRWFVAGDSHEDMEPNALDLTIKKSFHAIFGYPKWREVLRHFDLPEVDKSIDGVLKAAGTFGRGGGESAQHLNLKNEIAANPALAGIGFSGVGVTEMPIPSGDELDVCFQGPRFLAAVEVKTTAAPEADLARGFYQCIKYEAVLRKWVAFRRSNQTVSVTLLLEGKLPSSLLGLRNALGVRVVELQR